LAKLFDKYRGNKLFNTLPSPFFIFRMLMFRIADPKNDEKDTIGIDGTMAYLTELGVNLENASSLIPLEITQAPALGEMTKEEFVNGWKKV
jgi:hypothetical protein